MVDFIFLKNLQLWVENAQDQILVGKIEAFSKILSPLTDYVGGSYLDLEQILRAFQSHEASSNLRLLSVPPRLLPCKPGKRPLYVSQWTAIFLPLRYDGGVRPE